MGAFGLQTHIWNNNLKSVLVAFRVSGSPPAFAVRPFTIGYVGLTEPIGDDRLTSGLFARALII